MLRESELARRENGRIELRSSGLRVSWEFSDLITSDGHSAIGVFSCTVRGLPDPTEQRMLEESFLASRPVITGSDVSAYFSNAMGAAARNLARQRSVESLLSDSGRQELIASLLKAGGSVAFGCGVELLSPAQLDLDCPSLRKQQAEILQQQTAQRRAADYADHLKRSAELFSQFESIRASAPQLGPGQVLDRIGVTDQADLLRSLLLASAQKTKPATLWAVAGMSLIRIDESNKPTLLPMTDELGPFRSVNPDGQGGLLIGCRQGILRNQPGSAPYRDPQVTSQLGFNAAIATPGRIWATHGEAGLVSWSIDHPQQPDIAIRPSAAPVPSFAPRNLTSLGSDHLILSSAGQMLTVNDKGDLKLFGPSRKSDVAAIFVQPHRLLVVYEDGTISSASPDDGSILDQQRRSGRVTAAAALPWLVDLRLLLAGESGPIICIGPDDELSTQYASAHLGPRIVAGAAHAVAAVTSDRQRLLLWNAWEGRQPQSELHLYALVRHRIADITFA